jgi:hypothetical protein
LANGVGAEPTHVSATSQDPAYLETHWSSESHQKDWGDQVGDYGLWGRPGVSQPERTQEHPKYACVEAQYASYPTGSKLVTKHTKLVIQYSPRSVKPCRKSLRIRCHDCICKIYGLILSTGLENEVLCRCRCT